MRWLAITLLFAAAPSTATAGSLADTVVEAVTAAASELPGRLETVEIVRLPRNFPAGAEVEIDFRPNERFSGMVPVALVFGAGESHRKAWASARVRRVIDVVQPARRIRRGEVLDEDSVLMGEVDASRVPPGAIYDVASVIGQVARTTLRPGYALSPLQIEPLPVVRKGDQVQLIARHGPLVVTAPGRVEARTGAVGELVAMTNLSSKRRVQARIVDDRTAEVEMFHAP